MQLQGAATSVCSVCRGAVVQSPVPEQYAAGLQGYCGDAVAGDIGVANLPVASFEMYDRTFPMTLGDDVHTPIFGIRGVEGNPRADNAGVHGHVKVGVVLVPGFFASNAGRF